MALLRFKHVHRVLAVPFLAWVHRVFTLTIIRHGEAAISGSGIAADLAAQDLGGSNMCIVCLRLPFLCLVFGRSLCMLEPENELAFQAGWSIQQPAPHEVACVCMTCLIRSQWTPWDLLLSLENTIASQQLCVDSGRTVFLSQSKLYWRVASSNVANVKVVT